MPLSYLVKHTAFGLQEGVQLSMICVSPYRTMQSVTRKLQICGSSDLTLCMHIFGEERTNTNRFLCLQKNTRGLRSGDHSKKMPSFVLAHPAHLFSKVITDILSILFRSCHSARIIVRASETAKWEGHRSREMQLNL